MPFSHEENIEWVREILLEISPKTIIDVGPGAGKYGRIIRECLPSSHTTCVEIWAPYVEKFQLAQVYDSIQICDARIYRDWDCDLVILGDVLEHMSQDQALELWRRVSNSARFAMIAIPIVHYPQGSSEGNPFEAHIEDHWSHERVMSTFSNIVSHKVFEITGTYLAQFRVL